MAKGSYRLLRERVGELEDLAHDLAVGAAWYQGGIFIVSQDLVNRARKIVGEREKTPPEGGGE